MCSYDMTSGVLSGASLHCLIRVAGCLNKQFKVLLYVHNNVISRLMTITPTTKQCICSISDVKNGKLCLRSSLIMMLWY